MLNQYLMCLSYNIEIFANACEDSIGVYLFSRYYMTAAGEHIEYMCTNVRLVEPISKRLEQLLPEEI